MYNHSFEYVPVGYFTVEKPLINDGVTTFTAYDRMLKFDKSVEKFIADTYTIDSLLQMISTATGVTIIVPAELQGQSVGFLYRWRYTYTYREAISYFASYFGYFATINRAGELEFKWYSGSYAINADRYFSFEKSEIVYAVNRLDCSVRNDENGEEHTTVLTSGSGTKGISFVNPTMTQDRLNVLYQLKNGFSYQPSTVNFVGDIRLDVGDIVTLTDENSLVHTIPVMNLFWEFDGGLTTTVEAPGETDAETETTFEGPQTAKLDRVVLRVDGISQIVADKADITALTAATARITNLESTAITTTNLSAKVADLGYLKADTASLTYATVSNLNVLQGSFNRLNAKAITTDNLTTKVANLGYLKADTASLTYATVSNLNVLQGSFNRLKAKAITTDNISAKVATLGYATVANLNVLQGSFDTLNAKAVTTDNLTTKVADLGYLKADMANLDSANINKASIGTLLADVGLITSAVITDGHVTGTLDSVDINASKIKTGTLSVDRLVINGTTDSVIYALNNSGQLTSTHCNTLDGGLITEKTITASHIVAGSITANEIDVTNLFAQNITATGTITGASIYGGYFETYVDNSTNQRTVNDISIKPSLTLQLGSMFTWINDELCGSINSFKSSLNNINAEGMFVGSAEDKITAFGKFAINEQTYNASTIASYVIDMDGILGFQEKNIMYGGLKVANNWISAPAFYENDVALSAKYLQLAGGTLTGEIKRNGNAIVNTGTNGRTNFCGGTNLSNGANLILRGSTQTGYEGQFCLDARSGSSVTSLIGHPDGTLTWGSTTVLRSDNYNNYALSLSGGTLSGNLAVTTINNRKFSSSGDTKVFGTIPTIGSDGIMEVGSYIDFHASANDTSDYTVRLAATTNSLTINGNTNSTGMLKVANSSSSGSVAMWNDGEGGNIEIKGPSNTYGYQIDAYSNSFLRCYMFKVSPWEYMSDFRLDADGFHTNRNLYAQQDLSISRDAYISGNIAIGGTLNGYNIGGSVTDGNNGLVTGGTVYNKLGANQIIGDIETPLLKSSSSVANGGTAKVTVSYSEYGTDSNIRVMIIPALTQYCNVTAKATNATAKTTTFTLTNTSGASHTIGASFYKIYYKYKSQM